jgi:hypothetical protein
MAKLIKSGAATKFEESVSAYIGFLLTAIPRVGQLFGTVGQLVSFRIFCRARGCKNYRHRETLWLSEVLPRLEAETELSIIEYGVAFGEATEFWIHTISNSNLKYFGFDRFTGLPTKWRNLDQGAFSLNGQPPAIADTRISWFIGDVEDTVTDEVFCMVSGRKFIIFDLDLFLPSLHVWEVVAKHLTSGDLIWFDEAFDRDENLLIEHYVSAKYELTYLANSPMGLLVQIK